jgi:hypothetical protein
VQKQFAEKFPETPVSHRNAYRKLTEKFRETAKTAYIRNISQADLQKLFSSSSYLYRRSWTSLPTRFTNWAATFQTHCMLPLLLTSTPDEVDC